MGPKKKSQKKFERKHLSGDRPTQACEGCRAASPREEDEVGGVDEG